MALPSNLLSTSDFLYTSKLVLNVSLPASSKLDKSLFNFLSRPSLTIVSVTKDPVGVVKLASSDNFLVYLSFSILLASFLAYPLKSIALIFSSILLSVSPLVYTSSLLALLSTELILSLRSFDNSKVTFVNVELFPPVTVISVEVILPLANFSFNLLVSRFVKSLSNLPSKPSLTFVSVTNIPLGSVKLEFSLSLAANTFLFSSASTLLPSNLRYSFNCL